MSSKWGETVGKIFNFPAKSLQGYLRRKFNVGRFDASDNSMRYWRGAKSCECVLIQDIAEWWHVSDMAVDEIVMRLKNGSVSIWSDYDGRIRKHLVGYAADKFVDHQ